MVDIQGKAVTYSECKLLATHTAIGHVYLFAKSKTCLYS